MSQTIDEVFLSGIQPHLQPAERLLAACIAAPRGWGQKQASAGNPIARMVGGRKERASRAEAARAGLEVDAPMGLALTSDRLLTLGVSVTKMGRPSSVDSVLTSLPLNRVEAVEVKRFGLGKRITVVVGGVAVPLEGNAGANGLAAAFAARPAA